MTTAVDLERVLKVLTRKQIISIVEAQAPINIWTGSVRSGKTIGSLLRFLLAVADPPPDGEIVVIGKTRETIARNLFGPLTSPALFGPVVDQIHYTTGAPTATILGRTVHVIGANDAKAESKIRGMTIAVAYVDEVTVLPKQFFDQLIDRCSVPGARIFGTTNPDSPSHWLRKQFLLRLEETGTRTWHSTLDDNPHLDPSYVARVKRTHTGLWYRRFVRGEWVAAEGAVFDMWSPGDHVVDKLPEITRRISVGVDYGTTNPFHAVAIGLGADGCLYVTREYRYDSRAAKRQMTDAQYSQALRDWITTNNLAPRFTVVDPSAASFRVQLHRDGLTSTPGDNSVLDGIRTVSSLLGAGVLKIHKSCQHLIDEMPGYSWDDAAAERGIDQPLKVDDHGVDALRYGLFTTRSIWRHLLRADLVIAA